MGVSYYFLPYYFLIAVSQFQNFIFLDGVSSYWGPNTAEFQQRFDPELTQGEGPQRLRNLYFLYLLELRAIAKAAPYLEQLLFYTGNEVEDAEVQAAVHDILNHVKYVLKKNLKKTTT